MEAELQVTEVGGAEGAEVGGEGAEVGEVDETSRVAGTKVVEGDGEGIESDQVGHGGWLLDVLAAGPEFHSTGGSVLANGRIPYDAVAALAYAKLYCGQTTNSCGKFYESDCAHFMSHCLAAGGIGITGGDPLAKCPAGHPIRAREVAAAFYNASNTFSNVQQLDDYDDGRAGDFGFLRRFGRKSHAFLLAGPASLSGAPVFAHTAKHCGDEMPTYRIYFGSYYRIE